MKLTDQSLTASPSGAVPAPLPLDERARVSELWESNILDSDPEDVYDGITRLAAQIVGTPISLVSLVDVDRQWFKSAVGLDVRETPRDAAFCSYAILEPSAVFIVEDTLVDSRFATNPLVVGDPKIRFYAGVPLVTKQGHAMGTLCVIDREPRKVSQGQLDALQTLAMVVVSMIEARLLARSAIDAHKSLVEARKQQALSNELLYRAELRADSMSKFLAIFEDAAVGIMVLGEDLRVQQANRFSSRLVGLSESSIVGEQLTGFVHPLDRSAIERTFQELFAEVLVEAHLEVRILDGSGTLFRASMSSSFVRDETTGEGSVVMLVRDATDEIDLRDRLTHSARHDHLTGIPNRALFADQLPATLARAEAEGMHIAVMFMDLDGFKEVNDTFGHDVGDQLLRAVALRIKGALRPDDIVARLGGDEFTVLIAVADQHDAQIVAGHIVEAMKEPVNLNVVSVIVSMSTGIAISVSAADTPTELLRNADEAMYQAKNLGGGQVVVYGGASK